MKINQSDIDAVTKILKSQKLSSTFGNEVEKFEQDFAEYIGIKHAIAVNSGTAALHTALWSLVIGEGDEVIVPALSFASTATAVLMVGAKPVFVDIEKGGLNIDPQAVKEAITNKTKAILPVHMAGIPCQIDSLHEIAFKNDLTIIEDACQAVGSMFMGSKVGTLGTMGCFSFHASKLLSTGEGGMIVTNYKTLADLCRQFRNHGQTHKYHHTHLGYNYRMTEIQAALGRSQLKRVDREIRTRIAGERAFNTKQYLYSQGVKIPYGSRVAWSYYPGLAYVNVQVNPYYTPLYPMILPKQEVFAQKGHWPNAERMIKRLFIERRK